MPDYVYVGDEGRYYALPAPANAPVVGETYDLLEAPQDGRWTTPDGQPAPEHTPEPEPAPEPEPEVPSDPQPADPAPAGDTTTNQE